MLCTTNVGLGVPYGGAGACCWCFERGMCGWCVKGLAEGD